jgi:hypothetical protein
MQALNGYHGIDEDDSYPLYVVLLTVSNQCFFDSLSFVCSPLVMKVRSRSGSVMSGASTPGGGAFRSLSEGDLKKADAALSQVNGYH